MTRKIIEFFLSPTYFFADYRKSIYRENPKSTGKLIKKFNTIYLIISLSIALCLFFVSPVGIYKSEYKGLFMWVAALIIWAYPLSRANEVFYAFYKDAIEKLNGDNPNSNLTYGERIQLAFKSYIELIFNFATIYLLLPSKCFKSPPENYVDALYFSGVTITTLGYGDTSPICEIPKLLSVYQVLCGFILIIVSFAIYTGRGMGQRS
ncbi:MAG: two pore domain potassium channel family protein [Gammaproteobacteria bacterium]|nr:two pore domain potassium channel family protein [Gammaproteobacteria bacterium]